MVKLTGGPPVKGADHSAELTASIEVPEHTTTLTLTQEHRAEVHSSAVDMEADAEALTATCGHAFIKPELLDPKLVIFTSDLRVVNNELEIVNFVPAW